MTIPQLKTELAAAQTKVAALEEQLQSLAFACGVFVTPSERLKGWSEYKEDAARRIREVQS